MVKFVTASCLTLAMTAGLAACSSNDLDRMLGQDNNNDNNRQSSSNAQGSYNNAVGACSEAAQEKGWTVIGTKETGASGQNNIGVAMSVRQSDGDVRSINCSYDTGRKDARLDS